MSLEQLKLNLEAQNTLMTQHHAVAKREEETLKKIILKFGFVHKDAPTEFQKPKNNPRECKFFSKNDGEDKDAPRER